MSKKEVNAQDAAVAEAVGRTETFFENNGKKVMWALLAVVLVIAGGYAYKALVLDTNAQKAQELIVEAQLRLEGENPDYLLALNGNENGAGLLDVIDQYGSTPTGNLAKHYAGICYLRLGDLENAEKYLSKYSAADGLAAEIVNAQNLGLRGDIAVENGDYAAAAALYKKAVAASDNNYTAPLYLYKQGLALKAAGDNAAAATCFEQISALYPASLEAREADKLLGSINE